MYLWGIAHNGVRRRSSAWAGPNPPGGQAHGDGARGGGVCGAGHVKHSRFSAFFGCVQFARDLGWGFRSFRTRVVAEGLSGAARRKAGPAVPWGGRPGSALHRFARAPRSFLARTMLRVMFVQE